MAMGELAMDTFAATHDLFLNTSCNRHSLPGYLRLGFHPIREKTKLARYSFTSFLVRRSLSALAKRRHHSRMTWGVFVSDSPLVEEMASVVNSETHDRVTLRPRQDQAFFRWRYSDPTTENLFLYLARDGEIRAYVVIAISAGGLFGEILDYARTSGRQHSHNYRAHVDSRELHEAFSQRLGDQRAPQ